MQVGKHLSLKLFIIQAFAIYLCATQDAVFQFELSEITVSEDVGEVNVRVENTGNVNVYASVRVTTSDISATSNVDYIPINTIISFAAGETEKNVSILIVDDNTVEEEEAIEVKLSLLGPAFPGVIIGDRAMTTVVIADNELATTAPAIATTTTTERTATATSASNGGGNITLDVEAKIEVVCRADYIEVTLKKEDFPGIVVNDSLLHLAEKACVASYKDDDMIKFSFGLEACGTKQMTDKENIVYSNKIYLTADEKADDAAITRKHSEIIPFQCAYEKKTTISRVSYSPRSTQIITDAEGYGNFTYEMFMYESDAMKKKVENFPKEVGLGLPMYFGFRVISADGKLNVFPDVCKATASSEFNSNPEHLIIENACSKDNTLKYDYKKGSFHNFSVSAFRFKENYDDIFIHCKLTVCRESDAGSRCDRGCEASRRRRRSLREEMGAKLRIGPLSYKNMNNKKADQEKNVAAESSNSMIMIVAVLVGILGTIALGLVIAVIVVGRRRRYAAVNKGAHLIVAEEM